MIVLNILLTDVGSHMHFPDTVPQFPLAPGVAHYSGMKPEKEWGEAGASDGDKAQGFYPQIRAVSLLPGTWL